MEGAARAALAEVEARWRRDQFAAAQERNRLRAEIKELKEQQQQQQQSVPSGVDHSSPPAPAAKRQKRASLGADEAMVQATQGLTRTEMYAKYHAAETALLAEQDKVASLENSLSRLLKEMQQKLPVYKDNAARLSAALASNTALSERLALALRERDEASKARRHTSVELDAARATISELADSKGLTQSEAEVREALQHEKLATVERVSEAQQAQKEQLEHAQQEAQRAIAESTRYGDQARTVQQQADRWRVLYEASLAVVEDGTAATSLPTAATVEEVRALLLSGVTGQARARIEDLEAQLGKGSSGDVAKLKAAEGTAEKLRKAAAHWKTQYNEVKTQLDDVKKVGEEAEANVVTLKARASELAQQAQEAEGRAAAAEAKAKEAASSSSSVEASSAAAVGASGEIAELQEKLNAAEATAEKLRKAATHWKTQHGKLKEQHDAAAAATSAPAAASESAASDSAAELEAALSRIAELTTQAEAAATAKAALDERLSEMSGERAMEQEAAQAKVSELEQQAKALEARASELAQQAQEAEGRAAAAEAKAKEAASSSSSVEASSAAAVGASGEIAELQEKLNAAEATAEKLRKAATHWKTQHGKLKEQHDAAAAATSAPAAASESAASDSAAELEAALSRIAELTTQAEAAATAKAALDEQVDKFRKAATHWKRQFDKAKSDPSDAS